MRLPPGKSMRQDLSAMAECFPAHFYTHPCTPMQLETQTAQLRQAQDEVQRLQRQLAVQQDRAAQQEPQQCDGQDRLRELESKLEVKRRELASQQEAVKGE